MKSPIAIYETDIQYDFSYRQGKLFVRANKRATPWPFGAEERLPYIFAIHQFAAENGIRILGSVDRHFYEDAELIRNKGGGFEDHCMNGTKGQLRLGGLEPEKDIYVRSKDGPMLGQRVYTQEELGRYVQSDGHLIFEKQSYDVGTNPNFEPGMKLLFENGLRKIVFNGFATDYCVEAAVLGTAKLRDRYCPELGLYLVTDAIEAVGIDFEGKVNPEFTQGALDRMAARGVKFVRTKDVVGGVI